VSAALVLFARVPRLGQVKTRMTPWLSVSEALRLHLALLLDGLWLLRRAAAESGMIPIVSFSEEWTAGLMAEHDGLEEASRGLILRPQRGGDLGQRIEETFAGLHADGHREVVVIGSDCPGLTPGVVGSAFEALRQGERVVLGPAADGGYYLVGALPPVPGIFSGIPWGTARVMQATLAALDLASVRVSILPRFEDIDLPSDLERLAAAAPPRPGPGERTIAFVEALRLAGRLPPGPR